MDLNITTLILSLSLLLLTQIIVLFFQYKLNTSYKGIGSWLAGSCLIVLGYSFMPLVNVEIFGNFARIANPLLILGYLFLYIGVKKFLNQKLNKRQPIIIFLVFNLLYYYCMYIENDVSGRTFIITVTIALISFMITYQLFFKREKNISIAANFTAVVFFLHGCFYVVRMFLVIASPSMNSHVDQITILIIGLIIAILLSNLWTFGLILMINQRLNSANHIEKEKLQSIFNASPDDIVITDLEGTILMSSPAGEGMFGYEKETNGFIGNSIFEFIVAEDIERVRLNMLQLSQVDIIRANEYRARRKDGSVFDIEVDSGFVNIINGLPARIVLIIRDITERKENEQKIQKLVEQLEIEKNTAYLNSITDSLTGLVNRGYFDEVLNKELSRLRRSGSVLSLIMLDIDYFKKFNDRYGHVAGDQCLQEIARELKKTVGRASDLVARYGGEEFIIILPETDEEDAKILGERIRKKIEDLAVPHSESDVCKYVTVSLGIVTVHSTDIVSSEQILNMVDKALYSAKEQGRNRCFAVSTKE